MSEKTDIVERLRHAVVEHEGGALWAFDASDKRMCKEAADKIEHLRFELEHAREKMLRSMLTLDEGILRHGRDELGDNFEEVWTDCIHAFALQHGIDLK